MQIGPNLWIAHRLSSVYNLIIVYKPQQIRVPASEKPIATMAFINVAEWTPDNVTQWLQGKYQKFFYQIAY